MPRVCISKPSEITEYYNQKIQSMSQAMGRAINMLFQISRKKKIVELFGVCVSIVINEEVKIPTKKELIGCNS